MKLEKMNVSELNKAEMTEINGGFWGLIALAIIGIGIIIKTIEIINRD